MTAWFRLWAYAIRQGLWRDPQAAAVTLAQTAYIVTALLLLRLVRGEVPGE